MLKTVCLAKQTKYLIGQKAALGDGEEEYKDPRMIVRITMISATRMPSPTILPSTSFLN